MNRVPACERLRASHERFEIGEVPASLGAATHTLRWRKEKNSCNNSSMPPRRWTIDRNAGSKRESMSMVGLLDSVKRLGERSVASTPAARDTVVDGGLHGLHEGLLCPDNP